MFRKFAFAIAATVILTSSANAQMLRGEVEVDQSKLGTGVTPPPPPQSTPSFTYTGTKHARSGQEKVVYVEWVPPVMPRYVAERFVTPQFFDRLKTGSEATSDSWTAAGRCGGGVATYQVTLFADAPPQITASEPSTGNRRFLSTASQIVWDSMRAVNLDGWQGFAPIQLRVQLSER